jgi:hypothetical protein
MHLLNPNKKLRSLTLITMKKTTLLIALILELSLATVAFAQDKSFDLQQLLKEKKLITFGQTIIPITDSGKKGISQTGIAWVKDVTFSQGTIEVDLRGKDVFQKSFIGIAFHGVDTATYDAIYFRPFNFLASDPVRKIHAVQYVSEPDFPWHKLREEKNGIYEKAVDPAPSPTDWFHARIVVKDTQIFVYVNGSTTPSLSVKKLNSRTSGLLGIWNTGLDGDFANLVIKK